MCNIRLLILVIIIISCHLISCTWSMPRIGVPRYEGDICTLMNGDIGVCKRLRLCSSVLKDMQNRKRTWDSTRTCGYDNFTEIVCCPVNVKQNTTRPGPRPAAVEQPRLVNTGNNVFDGSLVLHSKLSHTFYVNRVNYTPRKKQIESSYMVAVGYMNNKTGTIEYLCGGSLISSQHVLTAAHCLLNKYEKVPFLVRLGSVNLADLEGIRVPISDQISHPLFRPSQAYYDVAILKLITHDVPNSYTQMPICLETESVATVSKRPSTRLVVLGWGATVPGDAKLSEQLMRTPGLSLVNYEECAKWYSGLTSKLPHGIDDSMICLVDGNTTRRADACEGDSGGPLLMSTESGGSLIGITAFGSDCGSAAPGVYTAVYPFLDWIEEVVWPATDRNENDNFLKENRYNYQH